MNRDDTASLAYTPTRIVIADDHPLVLSGLRAALQEVWPTLDIVQCLTIDAVAEAVERDIDAVDVILLDLKMPGANGFEALLRLLKRYPTTPIVVVSGVTDPDTARRVMVYGASGFLSKNMTLEEMVAAITKVLDGELVTPTMPSEATPLGREEVDWAQRLATLSEQQIRILRYIIDGKLNKQIAGELNIAEQTVKIHVSTILRKLGVRTRTQAAVAAQACFSSETRSGEDAARS